MFAYRLALMMGELNIDRLLKSLTAKQLAEWYAYYRICPFGQDHSDYLAAQAAAIQCDGKLKPEDFLPSFDIGEQSPDEIQSMLRNVLDRF